MSDSVRPHRRQPTRLCCPWDSPGKNTGVGCHFLLQQRLDKYLLNAYRRKCVDYWPNLIQFSSAAQSCPTLCDPMDCSMPGCRVHHQLLELAQTHVHQLKMPFNHLILCRPLLFLPSTFPSIRVFSNESVFHIRQPRYWSFSFSISPSSEYSGLI